MTKDDYRTALAALGLSQVAAAKVLGIADRTSRAYALGERPVPEPVALALRLLIEKRCRKLRARRRQQMQWRQTSSAYADDNRGNIDGGIADPVHEPKELKSEILQSSPPSPSWSAPRPEPEVRIQILIVRPVMRDLARLAYMRALHCLFVTDLELLAMTGSPIRSAFASQKQGAQS